MSRYRLLGWDFAVRPIRAKLIGRPIYVSLNRRGEIVMNYKAWHLIDRPWNVALMYDARLRCIAVKFPVGEDGHFFRVRRYGRGKKQLIVRGGRMLKQFGIKVEETLVFKDIKVESLIEGEPMLILDIGSAAKISRAHRSIDHSGLGSAGA